MGQTVQLSFRDLILKKIKSVATFPGIESREVVQRDMPSDWSSWGHRGISVIMHGEAESAGTISKDDYGYRFLVVFCAGTSKGSGDSQDWISVARTTVRRLFNNKRFNSEVPENTICGVQNDDVIQSRPWQNNQAVSVLVITCWAREAR